ncbi:MULTISPECIES: glycoside hydrolase family 127 protein [unclassified Rhizobium]|uniref:glycoside hydrolase family 127 protein n=1 Tax=unclassified Rhizobium TaxID=2613769 RepID=UPI001A9A0BB8|nr:MULTISPECIES: glycoside hydrolase family 127 protein [unclassified Rhizobium]MBX5163750.1 glycoside hydrolase family 127 protein [Rhizobium sp. NZLR4b]MBX5196305.1 glycoside hydrolase family 127 protein [Rhizobium sp. NZLR10]MBX5202414.1 glycoside hydrolase family 127 protein [Rhizobium sp. NZLR1]MBX5211475.1 glycoside hydrolase family 127 protein [Rhizobium sp. NZLR11]QSZ20685.1 glycoside hydrolase family 127 protein [Rhizobium sp. NZLR1]
MTKSSNDRQFRPVAVPDVELGGFWGKWQDAVCNSTAETLLDRCVEAGMLTAIDVSQPSPGVVIPIQPWGGTTQMFWDSDLGKSIETIAYSLYRRPNPKLEARADEIIDMYERLQDKDGYLNAWFQRVEPARRWTNLRDHHELYCAGHLMEAAVAYYQATGKRKLLDIMCRFADYMITIFGHGEGQFPGYCGHEEVELALVKLARVTGEKKYLELSKFFIDERGTEPHFFTAEASRDGRSLSDYHQKTYEYAQAHQPVREQTKVVGHAVRAMYLYSGMADIATEYKDDSLTAALETLWDDLTTKQMYITGGIGPAASNEGFTDYYDLPNATAYAETCASVGLVFWASRMLGRGPDRRYADIMEQALYNGALPGLSTDGKTFFYDNPLESAGKHHRWKWHHCPCCPPNIARLVTSIGSYMYAVADDEIAVHLYGESTARLKLANGAEGQLEQTTNYPWDGAVAFTTRLKTPARFALSLRIPDWAEGATLSVNGAVLDLDANIRDGYARIDRQWADGDRIDLYLPLALRPQYANPKVRQDAGRVALMRGPLVYCVETTDNGEDLNAIILPRELPAAETVVLRDLNDAVALDLKVEREETRNWGTPLYRQAPAERQVATARFVPYHLWDNRGPGEMLVWVQSDK